MEWAHGIAVQGWQKSQAKNPLRGNLLGYSVMGTLIVKFWKVDTRKYCQEDR